MKSSLFILMTFLLFAACKKEKDQSAPVQPAVFEKVSGFSETLTDVSFSDNLNGVITGTYGFIAKTNDGGNTWTVLNKPTGQSLISAFCLSNTEIFAARNGLHYSNDGGNSFQEISSSLGTDNSIKSIHFFDSNNGLIIKGKNVYTTHDKGLTWTGQSFEPGYLNRMQFVSGNVGYIYGGISYDGFSNGELYKTADKGATWTSLLSTEIPQIIAAHFINEHVGYYASFDLDLFKTTDGGNTWNMVKSGFGEYITDMHFADEQRGYIITYNGKVYATKNGGTSWEVEYNAPETSLTRIIAAPDKTIWVTGNDGVLLKK